MKTMPKKKRKPEDVSDKQLSGRPRTLPPNMDMRYQIRCYSKEFEVWEQRAAAAGFRTVSDWIRKAANDVARGSGRAA